MTGSASPDGTGTQSDEIDAALTVTLNGSEYASVRRGAASVLSAEIERLTRDRDDWRKHSAAIADQYRHWRTRAEGLERALASAAAPDERVLTEREQYTVGELLTCRTFDYPRVMTEAHAIIQRLVSARTPDQDTAP